MAADLQLLGAIARRVLDGKTVALTGAGMSTESGIPDFRSPGGLWERFDPMEYAHVDAFRRDPVKVWRMLFELTATVLAAAPNPAHRALAALERQAHLAGVITQNIDGLHQAGGSSQVVELHGGGRRLVCPACDYHSDDVGQLAPALGPPRCARCEAVLKPDVVLFGEPIPPAALAATEALMAGIDVLLVCGTSAEVSPASDLPRIARASGAAVYEFNLAPSLPARLVTERVLGSVGLTLPALLDQVRRLSA